MEGNTCEKGDVGKCFIMCLIEDLITSGNSIYNKYFRHNKRFEVFNVTPEERNHPICHIFDKEVDEEDVRVVDRV